MFHGLILTAWLLPFLSGLLGIIGYFVSRKTPLSNSTELLIIQITSINSPDVANRVIRRIRDYHLSIPFQIWVVTEPWVEQLGDYEADRIVIVPEDFSCKATYKARALEYSRTLRAELGLCGKEIKILFLDDDDIPSKQYITKTFSADYDICQGITVPRNNYGRFWSYLDDIRTFGCLTACSFFQGIGHPVWVHGEGLCVRASVEQDVTWDRLEYWAEDLAFGHAAADKGYRWGFIQEIISLTAPWSFGDFVSQRRRWLWAYINASRFVLTNKTRVMMFALHCIGIFAFILALSGLIFGAFQGFYWAHRLSPELIASGCVWLGTFGFCGWLGGKNLKHVIVAMILCWFTSAAAAVLGFFVPLVMGDPKTWHHIKKVKR